MSDRSPIGSSLAAVTSTAPTGTPGRRAIPHASTLYDGDLPAQKRPKPLKARWLPVGTLSPGDHFELIDGTECMVLLHAHFDIEPIEKAVKRPRKTKARLEENVPGTFVWIKSENLRVVIRPTQLVRVK